jgi:ectoine hydroxylase-related dioxygenase (phytanoyl-CoA dioxygenase family)
MRQGIDGGVSPERLADSRQRFAEQGFVRVDGLLTADEVERFRAAIDEGLATRLAGDTRRARNPAKYESSFHQCINLWEDVPGVRPLTFHPAIAALAAAILGVASVRVWHDQALYKGPGGRRTDPHQDQPYWPIVETDTVTAWIPLVDVDLDAGAMGYVPGSHRFGVRKFANIFTDRGFDLEHGPEARGVAPVFQPVPAGSVVFHHGLTIHTAGANDTAAVRKAHSVIFFADGSTRGTFPPAHPAVDRAGIAVGAPIDSAVTPIAHPRPAGDLPAPPPPMEEPVVNWPGWDWSTFTGHDRSLLPQPSPPRDS